MESSYAIKFSNLWKEYMKVLEETKWAFDLTLRNPVEKFFKSSPVYKFIRSFKIQNKINTARSLVELVEASSSLTQVECLTSI